MALQTEPFDVADYLTTPEAVSLFLTEVLEGDDPREFAQALSAVARARGGVAELANNTGMTLAAVQKALDADSTIELGTALKLIHALKLRLTASVKIEHSVAA